MDFNPLALFLMRENFFFSFNSNYICSLFSDRNEQILEFQSVSEQYCPHLFRGRVWKMCLRDRNEKRKLQLVSVCGTEAASGANGSF